MLGTSAHILVDKSATYNVINIKTPHLINYQKQRVDITRAIFANIRQALLQEGLTHMVPIALGCHFLPTAS